MKIKYVIKCFKCNGKGGKRIFVKDDPNFKEICEYCEGLGYVPIMEVVEEIQPPNKNVPPLKPQILTEGWLPKDEI